MVSEQGLEQGRQEGMELGVQAGQQSLIQKLSLKGMSIEMIAEMTDLSSESIKNVGYGLSNEGVVANRIWGLRITCL